jgi:hypothetical protein
MPHPTIYENDQKEEQMVEQPNPMSCQLLKPGGEVAFDAAQTAAMAESLKEVNDVLGTTMGSGSEERDKVPYSQDVTRV